MLVSLQDPKGGLEGFDGSLSFAPFPTVSMLNKSLFSTFIGPLYWLAENDWPDLTWL